jgi:hypothetical protein
MITGVLSSKRGIEKLPAGGFLRHLAREPSCQRVALACGLAESETERRTQGCDSKASSEGPLARATTYAAQLRRRHRDPRPSRPESTSSAAASLRTLCSVRLRRPRSTRPANVSAAGRRQSAPPGGANSSFRRARHSGRTRRRPRTREQERSAWSPKPWSVTTSAPSCGQPPAPTGRRSCSAATSGVEQAGEVGFNGGQRLAVALAATTTDVGRVAADSGKNPVGHRFSRGLNKTTMVELVGRYSNIPQPPLPGRTVLLPASAKHPKRVKTPAPRVHAIDRRLSPETLQQFVGDYQAGVSANQLAMRYQLSRSSVRRLLRESGVARRYQAMTELEAGQAAELYQSGLTISEVAAKLDRPPSTVQTALARRGVDMRRRHDYR